LTAPLFAPYIEKEDTIMRKSVVLVLPLLLAAFATVPAVGDEVKGKEITFKSGGEEIKGYLAVPEGKGPFPAVVVIQEWWGLNDWIKENARRFAAKGYVALAPDLYRGKVATTPMAAGKLMKGLPKDRALRDLKAAVAVLAKHDKVDANKIGSIGWCMGGGYSLRLALADNRIQACVICYGQVTSKAKDLESLNATVLGIFGTEDKGIPIEGVRKFAKALKTAGKKSAGINEYEAGHGFMRPNNGPDRNPAYRKEQAQEAWAAIDKFFAKTLKGR
jgi:carboxymethylenebutenolidase